MSNRRASYGANVRRKAKADVLVVFSTDQGRSFSRLVRDGNFFADGYDDAFELPVELLFWGGFGVSRLIADISSFL